MPDGLMKVRPDPTYKNVAQCANKILLLIVGAIVSLLLLGLFEEAEHLPSVQDVPLEVCTPIKIFYT